MCRLQCYRYFLYLKSADMRKNFDGLCGIVNNEFTKTQQMGMFLFINRRRNQIKLLRWRGVFCYLYKRLEKGTYELPPIDQSSSCIKLKAHELTLIIEGLSLLVAPSIFTS